MVSAKYSRSQSFHWEEKHPYLNVNDFGHTLSLTKSPDDLLFIGTTRGVLRSDDYGETWIKMGSMDSVQQIEANYDWMALCASAKELYVSEDQGHNWIPRFVCVNSEITDFLLLDDSTMFVTTGHAEVVNGTTRHRGDGVFKTTDRGATWHAVQMGLQHDRYYGDIVRVNDILVISSDEYLFQDGLLFISEDFGTTWKRKSRFNYLSNGLVEQTKVVTVSTLTADDANNLYISLNGSNGSVATQLTLYNSSEELLSESIWDHLRRSNLGYDWFYNESHQLFVTSRGDIFSNRVGTSSNLDGLLFLPTNSTNGFKNAFVQETHTPGLRYDECQLVETSNGDVYAVQAGDRLLYKMAAPATVGLSSSFNLEEPILYPIPVQTQLTVRMPSMQKIRVWMYDGAGREVARSRERENTVYFDLSGVASGMYSVVIRTEEMVYREQIVVE